VISGSTQHFDQLDQAALLGRACAVDVFVRSLNPATRISGFKWKNLPDFAAIVASKQAELTFQVEQQNHRRLAICEVAARQAREQMQEMITASGVVLWLGESDLFSCKL